MGDYRNQLEPDMCQHPGCKCGADITICGSNYYKRFCLTHYMEFQVDRRMETFERLSEPLFTLKE